MAAQSVPTRPHPRIGLVFGAGGVLGAAWMTGAVAAVQDRLPRPVGEVDMLVGTSAGSVLVAALRCGIGADELVAYQRGTLGGPLRELGTPDPVCNALPPLPRLCVGSPRLLFAALRAPQRVHPWVAASACLPQGRGHHDALRAMVCSLLTHARERAAPHAASVLRVLDASSPPRDHAGTSLQGRLAGWAADWAADGQTWIMAVDYDSGRRVAFGRHGAPKAALPDAVAASCSVPCWYRPTIIGGRRYIDGAVRSSTSASLLARAGLDEVYVLAPMASLAPDRPRNPQERLERHLRRLMTAALRRDVDRLRSHGARVTVLTPGPRDLAAMGANLMDSRRREDVFETSLHTSAAALRAIPRQHLRAA